MDVDGKVAIVTGAGAGIGAALAQELVSRGARVVLGDLSPKVEEVAATLNEAAGDSAPVAVAHVGDVCAEAVIDDLVRLADDTFGALQLYFANAGIIGAPGLDVSESDWDTSIDVNLRAHIRAAKKLVPRWVEAGEGYFVSTASAAGLLTQIGSATYTVTKHAAVGFAEWLNITYGDAGVRASCLCPMGVETDLLYAGRETGDPLGVAATNAVLSAGEVLTPQHVATIVLDAVADERCLILPHASVLEMMRQKTSDHERWLGGMRRYQASLLNDSR
ncbi:SDR family oxidoreductase [Calidifontibacter indicus]|uniref:NADP-dependent 3-hydroxy acid dehydrogenase YdfG n=1 Tax=Calidifontibacter indicus TaxID=419650 RepID=A0A3D9UXA3_9MICO|nr:SDR family oxidoreductase [Calidifontibacter indicus]REF31215.1 hypothetical protein DFJ65_2263 [Calidifontibacter indicus]